jgi:hypothetical protein
MPTTQELLDKLTVIENSKPADYAGNVVSQATTNYQNTLNQLEANAPQAYQSQYQPVIDNLMNQITNRKPFSYDFNADPMYQQYKDQYTTLGKQASMNAATNASNLSGGYANSYAVTAAAQANQQYLTELNNVIPQLMEAAQNRYDKETENLYNQFNMYGQQEDRNYGKYRDTVADYQANRSYTADQLARSQANDQWNNTFNYNQYRNAVEDWQRSRDYYNDRYNNSVANDQWKANFDYQQQRDAIADAQWRETFEYQKQQDAANAAARAYSSRGGGSSGGSSGGSKNNYINDGKKLSMDQVNFLVGAAQSNAGGKGASKDAIYAQVQAQYDAGKMTTEQVNQLLNAIDWYMQQDANKPKKDKYGFKDSQVANRR